MRIDMQIDSASLVLRLRNGQRRLAYATVNAINNTAKRIQAADPSRPVMLNLGQGVAWDAWHGRGVRTNHPEDYIEYVKGCDIASFDIYPAVSMRKQTAGKLWYVGRGVARLCTWAGTPACSNLCAVSILR